MALQIIPQLSYATGQKNHSNMREAVTNTSFMESQLTDVWNFRQQACTAKIDASIAGVQWNFMIP